MTSNSGRTHIWRKQGTRIYPSNIIEREYFGGAKVLVLSVIILVAVLTSLFQVGLFSSARYYADILFLADILMCICLEVLCDQTSF